MEESKFQRDQNDNRKGYIHHTGRSRCDNGYYYIEYADGKQDGLAFDKKETVESYLNHGKSSSTNANGSSIVSCGNINSPSPGSPGSFSNPF